MQIAPNILGGYAALVVFLWVSVVVEYQDRIHGGHCTDRK